MSEDDVATEYSFCQRFRRWAKRAVDLPRKAEHPEDDEGRTALIEEIWDFVSGLYVWGTPETLARVLIHLYRRKDTTASKLLTSLADEELRRLQQSGEGEVEPEDEG